MESDLLKPKAVAKMLSMSVPWVYKAAKKGLLPCVEFPGMGENGTEPVRFKLDDIRDFIDENYKEKSG
jgi:predicted DNA-binding transcriptional regulator AlpA